jgi:hypothetical protein
LRDDEWMLARTANHAPAVASGHEGYFPPLVIAPWAMLEDRFGNVGGRARVH